MANLINSLTVGGTTGVIGLPYGVCSTAAGTAAKTVTVDNFSLEAGAIVAVKFTYANSAANPTLNVNSTGAKAIYWKGAALASSQYWEAGALLSFVYNGTQWDLMGIAKDNNTTYTIPTSLPANGGNADTVDNKHASDFAPTSHVGDSTHITDAERTAWNAKGTSNLAIGTTSTTAAAGNHTHNYAGSSSAGGAATSANKVNKALTFNNGGSGVASGTTFDGSTARTISYNTIGAAAASHTHTKLSNKYTSRPTTANIASSEDRKGTVEFFTATSSMTTGKPPYDAHILHMNWDNTEGWDSQLAVRGSSTPGLAVRGMNGGTWGDWQEVAMKNHTHTNVGVVTLGGDVLALTLSSCAVGGLTPVITNSASTNLPSGSYGYSAGYVIRRVSDQATIVLFDYNTGDMATNTYINGAWKGWVKEATQDYVRDAISNIGSSTASGQVCEFDSGAINLTSSSSPYTNSKDSKSKWYWIWAYNSTLGGYMGFHVDWKALTSGGQPIFCGSNTTSHFGITVSKNSSNKLVVSVPNSATTVKRVVGYY